MYGNKKKLKINIKLGIENVKSTWKILSKIPRKRPHCVSSSFPLCLDINHGDKGTREKKKYGEANLHCCPNFYTILVSKNGAREPFQFPSYSNYPCFV